MQVVLLFMKTFWKEIVGAVFAFGVYYYLCVSPKIEIENKYNKMSSMYAISSKTVNELTAEVAKLKSEVKKLEFEKELVGMNPEEVKDDEKCCNATVDSLIF